MERIWNMERSGFVFANTVLGLEFRIGEHIWDGGGCIGSWHQIWAILTGGSYFRLESIPVSLKHKSQSDVNTAMETWSEKVNNYRGEGTS